MIQFEHLERNVEVYRQQFKSGTPFECVVIDEICNSEQLIDLYNNIPDPASGNINASRDYMFAKNKFEKSGFKDISPAFLELYTDITSERFERFLNGVTGEKVFIDKEFHGGGIHQGGDGSYLDMHADFNIHPKHSSWFRNLNVLIYLNRNWESSFGGELKLRHKESPETLRLIEPLFNRCVIMFTRDYTLHGYDKINFPPGTYRRSIAAYAYSALGEIPASERSTVWYPEGSGVTKKAIGRLWPHLVKIKGALFGSSTEKNK